MFHGVEAYVNSNSSRTRRLKNAIEAAIGRFEEQSAETQWLKSGRSAAATTAIRTLNISLRATIKPVAKDNERSPDYRVAAGAVGG